MRKFTPRNSWNYRGEMTHAATPHAYRVGFVNASRNWATEEVVVYDDGYDETNATRVDRVEWPGITDRTRAWKEGRFHLAQQRLRREVHTIEADFEHLVCERGDLVALQHDAIAVGLGSMRIAGRTDNGVTASAVTLDSAATMVAGKSYGFGPGASSAGRSGPTSTPSTRCRRADDAHLPGADRPGRRPGCRRPGQLWRVCHRDAPGADPRYPAAQR